MWTLANTKTDFFWLFWSKNDSNYLDVKLNVFKKDDNKAIRLVEFFYKGKGMFQPVYLIEKSGGHCSRELCYRGKMLSNCDTNTVQRHGWRTQIGSEGGWRSGPSKQKRFCDSAAVQCGQAREFFSSSPIFYKEERRRDVSTNCLCELRIWWN